MRNCEVQVESSEYFDITVHPVTWSIPKVFSGAWHIIENLSWKSDVSHATALMHKNLLQAEKAISMQQWHYKYDF